MAATSQVKPGIDGALYYNAGSYGSPSWTEITLVRDVTPRRQWDMGEAFSRETKAKLMAKTMIDVGASAVVRADPADTGYQTLYDASNSSSTLVDVLILDGPITQEGAGGVRFHANVNSTGQPQEANGIIYETFDLVPGWSSEGYPSSAAVGAASSVTFAAY